MCSDAPLMAEGIGNSAEAITPEDATAAIDFYKKAFGATEIERFPGCGVPRWKRLRILTSSFISGRCEGTCCPRTGRMDLEHELQAELDRAGVSRADDWIAGRDIGRGAPTAERAIGRRIAASGVAIDRAEGISDLGVIEHVEELRPELSAEPLRELEVLEYGEVHVLETGVTEDVPAHGAESSSHWRS